MTKCIKKISTCNCEKTTSDLYGYIGIFKNPCAQSLNKFAKYGWQILMHLQENR